MKSLTGNLRKNDFEELNADLFKNTLGPVKQVLEDSGRDKFLTIVLGQQPREALKRWVPNFQIREIHGLVKMLQVVTFTGCCRWLPGLKKNQVDECLDS